MRVYLVAAVVLLAALAHAKRINWDDTAVEREQAVKQGGAHVSAENDEEDEGKSWPQKKWDWHKKGGSKWFKGLKDKFGDKMSEAKKYGNKKGWGGWGKKWGGWHKKNDDSSEEENGWDWGNIKEKLHKKVGALKAKGKEMWDDIQEGDLNSAYATMKDTMTDMKDKWHKKMEGKEFSKEKMMRMMKHHMMGGMWGEMDEETKKELMALKTNMKTIFSSATAEVRGHLHQFKKFLKEEENFENATLSELYDDFKEFMLEEFEDDEEAFQEIIDWFSGQLQDENSPAALVLQHMKAFRKKIGNKKCNFGQMKAKMSRMFGHIGEMMKTKMQYMSKFMGYEGAKVHMVKGAEKMLKHMGIFPEEEMNTGPRTDVCLCV